MNYFLNNHIVGTVPKFNRKIVERGTIDTPNAQIHDRSLSWLGIGTSIKKKWRGLANFMSANFPC